jgi:hypothetical protein
MTSAMSALAPTPPDRLVDQRGRPYFAWDEDLTLAEFESRLRDADVEVRAYYLGKLMRQAKPDDVFTFVTLADLIAALPAVERYLGKSRDFLAVAPRSLVGGARWSAVGSRRCKGESWRSSPSSSRRGAWSVVARWSASTPVIARLAISICSSVRNRCSRRYPRSSRGA